MLTLDWPWLLLLLPSPWLLYLWMPAAAQEPAALRVPFFAQLQAGKSTASSKSAGLGRKVLLWLIWILLLLAAARPTWVGEPQPIALSGRDLLLAVDISGSMDTKDIELDGQLVNRLVAVKAVLGEFIQRRPADRLGLILFGSNAYMQTPLTFDHRSLDQLLQEAQIGFAGDQTAIGDAIGLGIKRLSSQPPSKDPKTTIPSTISPNNTPLNNTPLNNTPLNNRVLILLTDGANTAGQVEPLNAARMAAEQQIKIYTLGFGADEMLVRSLLGVSRVNPSADLDEASLRQIASTTGGEYFRARNIDELGQIYQLLDRLEPSQQAEQLIRPQQVLFHWPLGLALLLSLVIPLLRLLKRQPHLKPGRQS
ncbi:MAG: Ca-activated chloride channel family protein [Motiliproteus sp.]|jgi:Ca-activated chloride channel family protein